MSNLNLKFLIAIAETEASASVTLVPTRVSKACYKIKRRIDKAY